MEKIRKPFSCSSLFDMALNQSAQVTTKPICRPFNEIKTIAIHQQQYMWDQTLGQNCPEPCDLVHYSGSLTEIKPIGSNGRTIDLVFQTLDTLEEEEVPVHDEISMISAVRGSLGLFLGFSFLDLAFTLIQVLQEHTRVK